ncbi:MAG TPA: carboxypeptidase-like regulatory domain-containing protein [Blastocatellia bacterium]|nr:carboxypeptidase-like regulatory domain-containing protein [Blastocatellia bacterium]
MKQAMRLCALIAVATIAYANVPETQAAAAALGSIRGIIKDGAGNPLVGAAVMVMADTEESDKVVKRANTDDEGKFVAAGISPGRYRVKAVADGFKPVELAADVRPNKVTVFDSILLRRVGTLAEEAALNPDSKYATRRAKRTVFHYDETKKEQPVDAAADATVALTDRAPELHGVVNAFSQTTPGTSGEQSSFIGSNFAISEKISRNADLIISGQVGYGEGAPQRLEALTTAHAGDRHRLAVALGYARFTFSRKGGLPNLGQFSLSATDTFQVTGPVLVVYGLEFARFTEGLSGTSVLPRFEIAVDAGSQARLFAGIIPGSSSDTQSRVNLESGEIVLEEPKPVALTPAGEPIPERSYRLQFGGEQILSEKSSIEMMAFFDTVSGHGVGLLAIPVGTDSAEPVFRNEELRGRSRGVRVVYHHRVNSVIEGAIGYAFGEGQSLDGRGITEPATLFNNKLFHVFSAKIDANFIQTGTRISTVLRFAPEQAVFAIDPFQGQIATYDPNINISLTQELPSLGFLPGQWQAMVDLRNMLDQQASVADERQELIEGRFHRLVRIGLSLRF